MTTTEQQLTPDVVNGLDFKVADLSLADYGRRDIELSEQEMPGLMSRRAEHPHLPPPGAGGRLASRNISPPQGHAAAGVVVGPHGTPEKPQGVPVYAWKGETL